MLRPAFLSVSFCLLSSALPRIAFAQQAYTFTTVDYPGISQATSVNGIDSAGDVVGYYTKTTKSGSVINVGFVRTAAGKFSVIEDPSTAQNCLPQGISDSGVIVGSYNSAGVGYNGFLYSKGAYHTFDLSGGQTELTGISTNNLVVGIHIVGSNVFGFQRTGPSTGTVLPDLNGYPVHAAGINSSGTIVGVDEGSVLSGVQFDGFIVAPGGAYQIVDYPGAISTFLAGINNAGTIVGFQTQTGNAVGSFVFTNGQFTDFSVPGNFTTQAFGINSRGVIAGTYYDSSFNSHGFIATPIP